MLWSGTINNGMEVTQPDLVLARHDRAIVVHVLA